MITYLNIPLGIVAFGPQLKCGPGLVMLGSVGASLLGTGATIASQAATNSSNKRFAAGESEKAREWEAEQWQNRFEQQSDFAYDYSRFQNKQAYNTWLGQQQYNSPSYQSQRMLQAGFNPAAISASPTFGSTGLSPAPASSPSPAVATLSPLMSQAQNPVGVSDIGNFIKDVASAAKDNATLKPMVDNILADTENKNLINSYQRIENNLKAQKAPAEIQKAFQDVMKGKVEIAMMTSNKNLYDEQRVTEIFKQQELSERTILNYAQSKKFDAETMNILLEYENFNTLFDKRIEVMNSEIQRNRGAASAGFAQGRYFDALGVSQEFWNELNSEQRDTIVKSMVYESEKKAEELGLTSSQALLAKNMAEKVGKESDYVEARFWNETINDYLHNGIGIFENFTRLKAFKALNATQQARISKEMESLRLQEEKMHQKPFSRRHERYNKDGDLIGFDFTSYE